MENKSVYIILLNYKGYEDTTACIKSLRNITYANYHIVIVDNCSKDGSYEKLRDENPDCTVILSPENNGFSAGNNIGIHYAMEKGADYILLLNNDTEVKADFLNHMMKRANENTVVTPSIYYYDEPDQIWYADGRINYSRGTAQNGNDRESKYCDYASGCCLLIPRNIILQIGVLAEEYFMYYEDMDYSLRVIRNGFKIFYEKDAVVYHKVGRTAGRKSKLSIYYGTRNRFYIMNKYKFGFRCYSYTLLSRIIRFIQGVVHRNSEIVTLKAILDYYRGKMGKQF